MELQYYTIDAFASGPFTGNPAAVCPLEYWLDDDLMQSIAQEHNLAETAFLVREGEAWRIRWFTPAIEVDLCGHATLASAYVLSKELSVNADEITFESRSGSLKALCNSDSYTLDFPSKEANPCEVFQSLTDAIGLRPKKSYSGLYYLAELENENAVAKIDPNFECIKKLDCIGLIITAPGDNCDFVSRFFAPKAGIDEDPVTGSAHCMLAPHWAKQLGKDRLTARQIGPRPGKMLCQVKGERVLMTGSCRLYAKGSIFLEGIQ